MLLLVVVFAFPAFADPGPTDEVEIVLGDCDDGTTILRAHNTTDIELGWLIRIDGRLVDTGRLAPDERVERVYDVALGESHFYRIRLGLPGEGVYYSTEGTTDRTDCPTPSQTPPPSSPPPSSPPPTSAPPPSSPPPGGGGSTTSTPPVGGGGGSSTASPSVLGGTGSSPGPLPFTGSEDVPWLLAGMLTLLVIGTLAMRIASRPTSAERGDRSD
jgi:hypothetical protein